MNNANLLTSPTARQCQIKGNRGHANSHHLASGIGEREWPHGDHVFIAIDFVDKDHLKMMIIIRRINPSLDTHSQRRQISRQGCLKRMIIQDESFDLINWPNVCDKLPKCFISCRVRDLYWRHCCHNTRWLNYGSVLTDSITRSLSHPRNSLITHQFRRKACQPLSREPVWPNLFASVIQKVLDWIQVESGWLIPAHVIGIGEKTVFNMLKCVIVVLRDNLVSGLPDTDYCLWRTDGVE